MGTSSTSGFTLMFLLKTCPFLLLFTYQNTCIATRSPDFHINIYLSHSTLLSLFFQPTEERNREPQKNQRSYYTSEGEAEPQSANETCQLCCPTTKRWDNQGRALTSGSITTYMPKFSPSNVVFLIHPMPAQCKQNRLSEQCTWSKHHFTQTALYKEQFNNIMYISKGTYVTYTTIHDGYLNIAMQW